MEHINCPGVLVECGFLSNPEEDELLKNTSYQKKVAGILAVCTSNYLDRLYHN
jgi:N-acetylmuramoyl-L-alanine amidase